jgi:hypothetical protein
MVGTALRAFAHPTHWTMLRIARSKSTSPARGEVDGVRGQADSIKTHLALPALLLDKRGEGVEILHQDLL